MPLIESSNNTIEQNSTNTISYIDVPITIPSPSDLDILLNEVPEIIDNFLDDITPTIPPPNISVYADIEQRLVELGYGQLSPESFQSVLAMFLNGNNFETILSHLLSKDS